ncbi:glucokinase [Stylonychia lemnae]|uniref:Glucokinase n=1 Tax=Stylonychia lemnae TaxID=5949 RepID=A0A078BA88_STYLE|nr:glucokinase [Stylonychia lemnae]|eukprot:CDW91440.1 glucokinase [Stylonychia lemnae]
MEKNQPIGEQAGDIYILSGDLGGTNIRLSLLKITDASFEKVHFKHLLTKNTRALAVELNEFLDEIPVNRELVRVGIISIAAPVFDDGICPLMIDAIHWGEIREKDIQEATGIKVIRLLNDAVAQGYGTLNIPQELTRCIYDPSDNGVTELPADKIRLIYSVGTGLGFCMMSRPDESVPYYHYPSELGAIPLPLHNQNDRAFYKFLTDKDKKNIFQPSLSVLSGGCGLLYLLEFLLTRDEESQKKYSNCPILVENKLEDIQPRMVCDYAKNMNDELCIEVLKYFLDHNAKTISDQICLYLPLGGIFLSESVIQGMEFMFDRPDDKKHFIDVVQNIGAIEDLVKKIKITLITAKDLAIRGCVNFGRQNKVF